MKTEDEQIVEARRARLKDWFKDAAYPEAEKSLISQLINGYSSFGEKVARRLERAYNMPNGYLEHPFQTDDPIMHTEPALSPGGLTPEEFDLLEKFRKCPPSWKGFVKTAVDMAQHGQNPEKAPTDKHNSTKPAPKLKNPKG